MKKIIVFALLFSSFIACKKDKIHVNDPIIGSWNLVQIADMAGVQTAGQWGHTKSYSFHTDNTYSMTLDAKVTSSNYTLRQAYSTTYQKNVTFLSINNAADLTVYYNHDTLVIADHPELDGPIEYYVKE